MVFYFTATGNCLYAAKHFSDAPASIPQVMRGGQNASFPMTPLASSARSTPRSRLSW